MASLLRQARFNAILLSLMFLFQAIGSVGDSMIWVIIGLVACGTCAMDAMKFHEAIKSLEGEKKNG